MAISHKSVCIVGAGPAGLVAAKVLLQTARFHVTVFEKASQIGGIWSQGKDSTNGFLSPQTPVNLSRFTVSFSDLAWSSVDFSNELTSAQNDEHFKLPMFPRAWQVNKYLETYHRRYIPKGTVRLDTEVVSVVRSYQQADGGKARWTVTVKDKSGSQHQHHFHHVVIASGFFAQPRSLLASVPHVQTTSTRSIHSSQFRKLDDLFPSERQIRSKTILIIGSGNSAGEIAGVVAGQLSTAQNSSDPALRAKYQDVRILHVTSRPLYALPPFTPSDESSSRFLPLDFNFYNLAKRLPGPVIAGAGIPSPEVRDMLHCGIQTSIGSDQSDLGSAALVATNSDARGTVQVTLSEPYAEFVRSRLIKVVRGRVESLEDDGYLGAKAAIDDEGAKSSIGDIGAVVHATGYSPTAAVDFLDHTTKELLHFDRESLRLPLILTQWQTTNDAVPDLSFHGFYEGPYWGMMEMQARLTASRWLEDDKLERKAYEDREKMLSLRQAMHEKRLDVPQYWFGDYGGYMEEIAAALHLKRNDGPFEEREGPVAPARYLYEGDNAQEASRSMIDLAMAWKACIQGTNVARAVFRALHGRWKFSRRIESSNDILPSGTVHGVASFYPRTPTKDDKSGLQFDAEYLYVEEGTFATTDGVQMTVSRRYVYRYSEAKDQLSVWFVKPDSQYEVDYLFHNLKFATDAADDACIARADHLCIADMYRTVYRLPMRGIALPSFSLRHAVEGPQKSYTATTSYKRPSKG